MTCTHCIIQFIRAPIMVLFPSLTGTLTSLSFLLDKNSRNHTLFKLCVISKLAEVRKEKQTQIIKKSNKTDHLSENPQFKIPEVQPTDSVKFLVFAAHHSNPHNLRSLYWAPQDHSKLCHTRLRAAGRKPKEIHSDVNGSLIERGGKKKIL